MRYVLYCALALLSSFTTGYAEELPTVSLRNGDNEIMLTLRNSSPEDIRNIRVAVDPAALPAWLSVEPCPGVADVPRGERGGGKLAIRVVVDGAQGDAAVIPFALSDDAGHSWTFRAALRVDSNRPMETALFDNYPNPFNPSTSIRFSLKSGVHTRIVVFNTLGQAVRTLVNGPLNAGYHTVQWNGTDDRGLKVASGMYLYRISAGGVVQTKKMMITE